MAERGGEGYFVPPKETKSRGEAKKKPTSSRAARRPCGKPGGKCMLCRSCR